MYKILRRCKLDKKGYTPHTLRHTFATDMLNTGVALHMIRDLLGHRSLDQTLIYAQISSDIIRNSYYTAVTKLENENNICGNSL